MHIYIPTRGRPNFSALSALPKELQQHTTVVIRHDECELYGPVSDAFPHVGFHILPKNVEGLAQTRQYILGFAKQKYIAMIDDDITSFVHKRDPKLFGALRTMKPHEVPELFAYFEWLVGNGVVCASTNDRLALARPSPHAITMPSRVGQVMFINRTMAVKNDYRFDRIEIYHDQDFALQIVRDGKPTATSNIYGHNMRPLYAKGGLSAYRDQSLINLCADKLEELHPEYVTITWKQRGRLLLPTRKIAWMKAFTDGKNKRAK